MNFLDPKEDVIEFQLTPYGRNKLSKGEFKPVFYSFFDEDIIYDYQHLGMAETPNAAHDRILSNVVLKPFVSFTNNQSGSLDQSSFDRDYAYFSELGTTDDVEREPSWEVRVLHGEISSSLNSLTGTLGEIYIPQINMKDLYVKTRVVFPDLSQEPNFPEIHGELFEEDCGDETTNEFIFADNGEFRVDVDTILLEIYENNVKIDKKNFDIELFEVEGGNILKPLKFFKETKKVVNDILLDDDEIEEIIVDKIEETDVEYFFDIIVDDNIEMDEICEREQGKDKLPIDLENEDCKKPKMSIKKFPQTYVFKEFPKEDDQCPPF